MKPSGDDDPRDNSAKPRRSRRDGHDSEERFQRETALFFDFVLPTDAWWSHFPNGGHRHMLVGASLKRQGTQAGAPDNLIIWQGKAHWVELKSRYGTLRASQQTTIPAIEAAGSPVAVARTLEDVEAALTAWGIPLRASLAEFRVRKCNRVQAAAAATAAAPQSGKHTPQTRMSVAEYRAHIGLADAKPTTTDTTMSASAEWAALSAAIRRSKPNAKARA
jgi:hypothetical protein